MRACMRQRLAELRWVTATGLQPSPAAEPMSHCTVACAPRHRSKARQSSRKGSLYCIIPDGWMCSVPQVQDASKFKEGQRVRIYLNEAPDAAERPKSGEP